MRLLLAQCMVMSIIVGNSTCAQDPVITSKPTKEHQWLQRFEGEWNNESEGSTGPDQPPMKCKGEMKSRMLGELWIVSDLNSNMAGMKIQAVQTIGYDPDAKKFVGTWVDSMMNHLWKYSGTLDESGKKLTLEAEGPNFLTQGKTAKYRDAYEFKSADHIEMSSSLLGDDGKWCTFMTGKLTRKK